MSSSARSVFVFGIYLLLIGLGFLIVPNTMLGLFGIPATSEPWIRVVGMLLLLLAFYYTQAARVELTDFFRWTVPARASVIVFFAAFVLLGYAPAALIMFGVVDLLGAIWTWLSLRSSKTAEA